MAQTVKRKTARGEARYDVRYRTPAGEVRNKTFRRAEDARNFVTGIDADKLEGRFVDPRSGRMTVGDWWEVWWPTVPNLRPSTRARDESYFASHVRPAFGATPLTAVSRQAIAEWLVTLTAKGLAPATVQKAHQILSKTLRAAVDSSRLAVNPAQGVPLPRIERDEMRFLTPANVEHLAGVIDPNYRAFVILGAYGGLRLGEMLGLRWASVDLERRRVDVASIQTEVRGHLAYGPPKTRAGRRGVPLPRVAANALTEHQGLVPGDPDALVFPAQHGGATRASLFRRRVWTPATNAARLAGQIVDDDGELTGEELPTLRIHDLRHTAVSFWIAAGASPREVATRAGHTSVSVVLDRYGHLLPGHEDKLNDALDALAEGASRPEVADVVQLRTA